ncbi:hypothetical protein Cs7R123_10560 [Catellatospora sp. TT07R-123]|nr:hypothetical protein Cs7R123_10560 [Catellatospora sp. TT07R-123]
MAATAASAEASPAASGTVIANMAQTAAPVTAARHAGAAIRRAEADCGRVAHRIAANCRAIKNVHAVRAGIPSAWEAIAVTSAARTANPATRADMRIVTARR